MAFINWNNLANKKSHMVNLVSVILPEKIQFAKKNCELFVSFMLIHLPTIVS